MTKSNKYFEWIDSIFLKERRVSGFYVWTAEELGLEVEKMDQEHQELVKRMNALYDGVEEEQSPSQIQNLIDDLAEYTVQHFADEEAYMEEIGFTGLATHKIIHQQLLKQFAEHVENFKKQQKVQPEFFNFLKVWLTAHIKGIDMKYSNFVKEQKAS